MTKKDFELIARALKSSKPINDNPYSAAIVNQFYQWEIDVNMFANRLGDSNPRFNREKFLKACGFYDKANRA